MYNTISSFPFIFDGHLHCFLISATVSNTALNIGCMYLFEFVFSFLRYIFPREELLDHLVYLFLVFGRNHYFSIVAAPIYVPTNSILRFPFLQILTNVYLQIF